ncbi:hypothetical protein [Oleisolibacter albus]|uniref:hypothetical protein n=1 Tax=Oleisolibacter albus TaxID=2171757 RepID=UPI0012D816C6|nr:hypothetical protein [Oleisolibacter albus]
MTGFSDIRFRRPEKIFVKIPKKDAGIYWSMASALAAFIVSLRYSEILFDVISMVFSDKIVVDNQFYLSLILFCLAGLVIGSLGLGLWSLWRRTMTAAWLILIMAYLDLIVRLPADNASGLVWDVLLIVLPVQGLIGCRRLARQRRSAGGGQGRPGCP